MRSKHKVGTKTAKIEYFRQLLVLLQVQKEVPAPAYQKRFPGVFEQSKLLRLWRLLRRSRGEAGLYRTIWADRD